MDDFSSMYIAQQAARERNLAEIRKQTYEYLDEPDLFAEWLSNRDELGNLGKAGVSNLEPLAQFLESRTGYECDVIGDESIRVRSSIDKSLSQEISLPGWAKRYLKATTQNGKKYGDTVTAKDCLSALDQT
jgi:hypothetical protein